MHQYTLEGTIPALSETKVAGGSQQFLDKRSPPSVGFCPAAIATPSCAHLQKIDTEKDAAGGSRQTLTTGSDVRPDNTWEQDQDQNTCLLVYRPLENKTERQTASFDVLGTRTRSAAHQTIVFSRTRQRKKRLIGRAGNKNLERCSPTDR